MQPETNQINQQVATQTAIDHVNNAIARLAQVTADIESARMEIVAAQVALFTYPRHMRDKGASAEIGKEASHLLNAQIKIARSISRLEPYVSTAPKASKTLRR